MTGWPRGLFTAAIVFGLLVVSPAGRAQEPPGTGPGLLPYIEQDNIYKFAVGMGALAAAASMVDPTNPDAAEAAVAATDAARQIIVHGGAGDDNVSLSGRAAERALAAVEAAYGPVCAADGLTAVCSFSRGGVAPGTGGPMQPPPLPPNDAETLAGFRALAGRVALAAPSLTRPEALAMAETASTAFGDITDGTSNTVMMEGPLGVAADQAGRVARTARAAGSALATGRSATEGTALDLAAQEASRSALAAFLEAHRNIVGDWNGDGDARLAALVAGEAAARFSSPRVAADSFLTSDPLGPTYAAQAVAGSQALRVGVGDVQGDATASYLASQAAAYAGARGLALACRGAADCSGAQRQGLLLPAIQKSLDSVASASVAVGQGLGLPPEAVASDMSAAVGASAGELGRPANGIIGVLISLLIPEDVAHGVVADAARVSFDHATRLGMDRQTAAELAGSAAGIAAPAFSAGGVQVALTAGDDWGMGTLTERAARLAARATGQGLRGYRLEDVLVSSAVAHAAGTAASGLEIDSFAWGLQAGGVLIEGPLGDRIRSAARGAARGAAGAARDLGLPPQMAATAAADSAALAAGSVPVRRRLQTLGDDAQSANIDLQNIMAEWATREAALAARDTARQLGLRNPDRLAARAAGRAAATALTGQGPRPGRALINSYTGVMSVPVYYRGDTSINQGAVTRAAERGARAAGLGEDDIRHAVSDAGAAADQFRRRRQR